MSSDKALSNWSPERATVTACYIYLSHVLGWNIYILYSSRPLGTYLI